MTTQREYVELLASEFLQLEENQPQDASEKEVRESTKRHCDEYLADYLFGPDGNRQHEDPCDATGGHYDPDWLFCAVHDEAIEQAVRFYHGMVAHANAPDWCYGDEGGFHGPMPEWDGMEAEEVAQQVAKGFDDYDAFVDGECPVVPNGYVEIEYVLWHKKDFADVPAEWDKEVNGVWYYEDWSPRVWGTKHKIDE